MSLYHQSHNRHRFKSGPRYQYFERQISYLLICLFCCLPFQKALCPNCAHTVPIF